MTPLKTLNDARATKEQLREALARALGVPYQRLTKEQELSVFAKCRDMFLSEYKNQTGLDYSFEPKDGKALSSILSKFEKMDTVSNTPEAVENAFNALIYFLPPWYRDKGFSLTVINSKFNEIIADIKNAKGQQTNSSYKDSILRDLEA